MSIYLIKVRLGDTQKSAVFINHNLTVDQIKLGRLNLIGVFNYFVDVFDFLIGFNGFW